MNLPNQTISKPTLAEFLQLVETKPEQEYLAGEISQKPMPQGEHSVLQAGLVTEINRVGKPQKLACAFPELRCTFAGSSIVPDVAVFEWQNIPLKTSGRIANKFEVAPDWTIEILSPNQSPNRVIRKITFCLSQGTKLGWLIDPEDESVVVFEPNVTPVVKADRDILLVLEALASYQLSAANLFSWLNFD
ncbi:MAG: Uma2 family endonuclease [Pleurocapsa minor HA4230-MV1]|nr:Uma2 family endonuclease [Pleurocapsa minor HA4230-MV1]